MSVRSLRGAAAVEAVSLVVLLTKVFIRAELTDRPCSAEMVEAVVPQSCGTDASDGVPILAAMACTGAERLGLWPGHLAWPHDLRVLTQDPFLVLHRGSEYS